MKIVVLVLLAILLLPVSAVAMEAWCAANPTICVCGLDFQGTSWELDPNGEDGRFWRMNPATSETKYCMGASNGKAKLFQNGATPQIVSAGIGSRVATRLTFTATNPVLGAHLVNVGATNGRYGGRYYIKLSSDYQTQNEAACTNDKYMQIGGDHEPSYFEANLGAGFKWGGDAVQVSPTVSVSQLKGTWYKIELYASSISSLSRVYDMYMTNLTTGQVSSVSNRPCPSPCDTPIFNSSNGASSGFNEPFHRFRQDTCNGHYDVAYLAVGYWPTNSGQRIPGATEMEGAQTPPPAAPSNLSITAQ